MIWFKRMNKKNLISTLVSIALLVVFSIAIEGTVTLSGIFSLIFIFRVKKELLLFVLFGYIIVILISNVILKKLYSFDPPCIFTLKIFPVNASISKSVTLPIFEPSWSLTTSLSDNSDNNI